jgi:hypothetical protein
LKFFAYKSQKVAAMENENPYASPRSSSARETPSLNDVEVEMVREIVPWPWRWQSFLLIPDCGQLPELCAHCGRPTTRPLRPQRIQWCKTWIAILVPAMLIIGQRKGVVFYTLCEDHDSRQKNFKRLLWGLGASAFVQFFLGVALIILLKQGWPVVLMLTGFFSLLGALVMNVFVTGPLSAEAIENGVIWLKNLPPKFYSDLPQLPSLNGRKPIIPDFD